MRATNTDPATRMAGAAIVALAIAVSSSGCGLAEWARNGFKVGPDYLEPAAETASQWIDFKDPRVKSEADLTRWWTVFRDPALDQLIDLGLKQSLTLRAAGERIVASRADLGFAVGNIFPQRQDAFGSYARSAVSLETATTANLNGIPGFRRTTNDWQVGFAVGWELDFWGKFRRAIESAGADLDASVADYDDVLIILLGDIGRNYVDYRTFQERLAFAGENVEIQQRSYELASERFKAGAVTERDVQQAKQVLEATRAAVPPLEAGRRQAQNALCVLLGMPPRALSDLLPSGVNIPQAPAAVAVGIPADLLRRRPDVRRAERNAASQSAQIGVNVADFYPAFSLLGEIGFEARDLYRLPDAKTGFASVGPSFNWKILHYGRIESRVAAAEARFRELVAIYQESVVNAGREADDAIILFLTSQERAERLAESVAAADRVVAITLDQYKVGAIDFTPVFLFEQTLAQQKDQLAAARGDIAKNLITLYQALGGGWEVPKP
jgi:NodT family efflux transporter outer membrane factor (OMF) lipoprotein